MKKDKKRISGKEKKRLKFIREAKDRRNESKKGYDKSFPGKRFRIPKSKK